MEKNFELKLNPEEKDLEKRIGDFIEEKEKSALEPIPGEIEKTPLEKEFVGFAEKAIQEEIRKCGSERDFSCPPDLIHVLPKESFESLHPETYEGGEIMGFWDSSHGGRIVMKEPENGEYGFSFYKDLTHEMLHEAGHAHLIVQLDEEKNPTSIKARKVGFSEANMQHRHHHFVGLNELMTEKLAYEILLRNTGIRKFMKGKQYTVHESVSSLGIISRILEKLSKEKGISEDSLWREMERSYFDGDVKMQYVRDIENVFGKSSLRVLDCIEPYVGKEEGINAKIHEYFATEDSARRDVLREEILNLQK